MKRVFYYANEKLSNAVRILATHPGDARARLKNAYFECNPLDKADFPEELQKVWLEIVYDLTKKGPIYKEWNGELWKGSLENTLEHMYNKSASKIARKVYDLYKDLSKYENSNNKEIRK
jgi:hypothetical protein